MATISADPVCHVLEPFGEPCPRKIQTDTLLIDADINWIIEQRLGSTAFRVLRWTLDRLGETNGFLGQYFNLNVVVSVKDETQTLRFFAKTPPPEKSPQYEFLTRYDTFNKEITVYMEVFPKIGIGHHTKWSPKCYLGKKNMIIVLEDACELGYGNPNKYVAFDEEHCVWIVKTLSSFHSRSLILDEKLRRSSGRTIHDLYGHLLTEVLFVEKDHRSRRALISSIIGSHTLVDLTEGLKDEERALVKRRIKNWAPLLPKLLEPSTKYRNVMCHRDIWANNIMFKHDSKGKVTGCYILDYQFLRYSPPATDFMFVLYLVSNRETRDRHIETLQRIYYETMRIELAAEGLDIAQCLPWSEFLESCKDMRKVALLYAVTNLQVMLLTAQAVEQYFQGAPDLLEEVLYGEKRYELVNHQCRVNPAYRERMSEVIVEILEQLPDQPPDL